MILRKGNSEGLSLGNEDIYLVPCFPILSSEGLSLANGDIFLVPSASLYRNDIEKGEFGGSFTGGWRHLSGALLPYIEFGGTFPGGWRHLSGALLPYIEFGGTFSGGWRYFPTLNACGANLAIRKEIMVEE